MLRLLRGCYRASSQILETSASAARVSGRQKAGTPWAPPLFLRPPEDGRRGYHTSKCCFKEEAPAGPPPTVTSLPNTPKPALYIALTGLAPFVAPPLIMLVTKTYVPVLAFSQMAYGASFLSFLGGVRWGFTLTEDGPAKPDILNLACSGAPLVFSWYAFLISEGLTEAIVLVIMGFGVALHNEVFLLPHYPHWFKALRIVVTLVVFFSFVGTLIIKDFYPEADPKQPGQLSEAHSPGKL